MLHAIDFYLDIKSVLSVGLSNASGALFFCMRNPLFKVLSYCLFTCLILKRVLYLGEVKVRTSCPSEDVENIETSSLKVCCRIIRGGDEHLGDNME